MFAVFAASPVTQMNDSTYSMLTAQSLIQNGTPDLSRYVIPDFEAPLPFWTIRGHHAYQLVRTNGRLLYGYPHGTSFLSMPFVALMNRLGVSAATRDMRFDFRGELLLQKLIAAFLSASLVTVLFGAASLVLTPGWSAAVAIGAGLGTQIWSTASRGMWQHTWEIMIGSLVVYLLLAAGSNASRIRPVLLATLLSWMFYVRPTGAVPVIFVAAYVFTLRRPAFKLFVATGIAWLAVLILYSLRIFGSPLPFYYYLNNDPQHVGVRIGMGLYGTLLSPSRGLFIFSPIVSWVLFVTIRFWRRLPFRPLATTALLTAAGILIMCVLQPQWWGGACYGPRLLADAVPWLVLLAILGLAAIPPDCRNFRNPVIAVAALLLLISIAMNACGALSPETMEWNFSGRSPDIMLDWSRPQFLAAWTDQR
jgi:hypothetical protein